MTYKDEIQDTTPYENTKIMIQGLDDTIKDHMKKLQKGEVEQIYVCLKMEDKDTLTIVHNDECPKHEHSTILAKYTKKDLLDDPISLRNELMEKIQDTMMYMAYNNLKEKEE